MQKQTIDALSGTLVPVLLGSSRKALQSARSCFRTYGVLSHLFSARLSFFYRLYPAIRLHRIPSTRDEALLLQALLDFAKQFENADRLLYLIPCTAFYKHFVASHKAELERFFVITDADRLSPAEGQEVFS